MKILSVSPMHRKTNLQTTVIPLDSTVYFQTLFSTQCLRDNGHHRNGKLDAALQSELSSESIDYPHVINSNYPPVKSKTTQHITDDNSPIMYRTSELITSNLKMENWFHKPINNDRLFTDHQSLINADDNQYQHLALCCAHMIGFIAVIILLSQYFGIRIVEKSKNSVDSARTIYDVLVDPANIDVVFEFNYIDEYVKHKKRRMKIVRKPSSTLLDLNHSGWESVGIQQSFRDKSGMKRDEYLKKRKCTSVGPILLEIELPVRSDNFNGDNNWNSVDNKLSKRKESDGNSTSGSYTTSCYVCVIFIFIYFMFVLSFYLQNVFSNISAHP